MVREHDHVVNLYVSDEELVRDLVEVAKSALQAGASWLMIATDDHLQAFEAGMGALSVDLRAAAAEGRYLAVGAQETLDILLVDGMPERQAFERVAGELLVRLEGGGDSPRRVHAFGEMVALLWESGEVLAAIELESLWNELIARHELSLYCAYPVSRLADEERLGATSTVCNLHSRTIAPTSAAARQRETAEQWRMFFPMPNALHEVRSFVRSVLATSAEDDRIEDACLIATELATNALRHVGSPFIVSVRDGDGHIRVAVRDTSPAHPTRLHPSPRASNGRGLPIVEEISTTWGTDDVPDGKVVWADLAA